MIDERYCVFHRLSPVVDRSASDTQTMFNKPYSCIPSIAILLQSTVISFTPVLARRVALNDVLDSFPTKNLMPPAP